MDPESPTRDIERGNLCTGSVVLPENIRNLLSNLKGRINVHAKLNADISRKDSTFPAGGTYLTYDYLKHRTQLSHGTISNIVNGKQPHNVHNVFALLDVLLDETQHLFGEDDHDVTTLKNVILDVKRFGSNSHEKYIVIPPGALVPSSNVLWGGTNETRDAIKKTGLNVLSGPPGSGKSSLLADNADPSCRIEFDGSTRRKGNQETHGAVTKGRDGQVVGYHNVDLGTPLAFHELVQREDKSFSVDNIDALGDTETHALVVSAIGRLTREFGKRVVIATVLPEPLAKIVYRDGLMLPSIATVDPFTDFKVQEIAQGHDFGNEIWSELRGHPYLTHLALDLALERGKAVFNQDEFLSASTVWQLEVAKAIEWTVKMLNAVYEGDCISVESLIGDDNANNDNPDEEVNSLRKGLWLSPGWTGENESSDTMDKLFEGIKQKTLRAI